MILQSLRPYWLPLAYLEKGNIDPVILGRLFRNAVYALEKHALYLRDRGGIEYPPTNNIGGMPISQIPCGLTADDFFELEGGEDFDDSGFA
jgi:hypothetical protein